MAINALCQNGLNNIFSCVKYRKQDYFSATKKEANVTGRNSIEKR